MTHGRTALTLAALCAALAACGSSASSSGAGAAATTTTATTPGGGGVVFTGDVTGTWTKAGAASESTCGADEVVIHISGPASGDEGDLHVKKDGSILLDAEKYGDFTATTGAAFHAGTGFDVDADLATARGMKTHAKGSLGCS